MTRSLLSILLLSVLCAAPVTLAEHPADGSAAEDTPQVEATPAVDEIPETLEPLPWETPEPEDASASCNPCPDYCNYPCETDADCAGLCPEGISALCLRAFGTCGGSFTDTYCDCLG